MNLQDKAQYFKALGEPSRLKIVDYLSDKDCCCICELAKLLKKDQSVVFRHVQLLKDAGIIETNKETRFLMCCLKDKKVLEILEK